MINENKTTDYWKGKSKYNLKICEYIDFPNNESVSCHSYVVSGDLKSCKKIFKSFVEFINFSKNIDQFNKYNIEIVRCCDGKVVRQY